MKKLLFLLTAGMFTLSSTAQDLPMPSPLGKAEQKVGLTTVSIEYSRPSAKGRKIFGELVAFDELWRFGANNCTKFTTNTAIAFEGKTIDAGTYALFAIPSENEMWTLILNSDSEQSGTGSYNKAKNVVSAKIKATTSTFTETFTLEFADITNNSGSIVMRWENISIALPFTVKTNEIAEKNISEAIKKGEDLEQVYYKAAAYYFRSLNDDRRAMILIEQGLAVKETHGLHFLKAQILFAEGDTKAAKAAAEIAYKLALEADAKGYADYIKSTMDTWK